MLSDREVQCWSVETEEFENNKGAIRIHISKKNRQHNGQKKSTKEQTTIYKTDYHVQSIRFPIGTK